MELCCRICRRSNPETTVPLSYRSDVTNETVSDMIQFVAGVEEAQTEDFPQIICRMCMGSLLVSFELKRACIESDEYFRRKSGKDGQVDLFMQVDDALEAEASYEVDDHDALGGNNFQFQNVKVEPSALYDESNASDDLLAPGPEASFPKISSSFDAFVHCCFPRCQIQYPLIELLVQHAIEAHPAEKEVNEDICKTMKFTCEVCASGFDQEVDLLNHRTEQSPSEYRCKVCSYATETRRAFLLHTKLHSKGVKTCVCGYKTANSFCYNRHRKTCNPEKKRGTSKELQMCPCGYNSKNSWCFNRHVSTCRWRQGEDPSYVRTRGVKKERTVAGTRGASQPQATTESLEESEPLDEGSEKTQLLDSLSLKCREAL